MQWESYYEKQLTGHSKPMFRPHFMVALFFLISTFVYLDFVTGVRPVSLQCPLSEFPAEIGQWVQESEQAMDEATLKTLGVDDYFMRTYTRARVSL